MLVAVDPDLRGSDKIIEQGDQLVVHVTRPERYGIALLLATGAKDHLEALAAVARRRGLRLESNGVLKKDRVIAQGTEENIYEALGLPYIAPELRETGKEVQLALRGALPELMTEDDLHGILHAHTTKSDGSDSLEDMAEATR